MVLHIYYSFISHIPHSSFYTIMRKSRLPNKSWAVLRPLTGYHLDRFTQYWKPLELVLQTFVKMCTIFFIKKHTLKYMRIANSYEVNVSSPGTRGDFSQLHSAVYIFRFESVDAVHARSLSLSNQLKSTLCFDYNAVICRWNACLGFLSHWLLQIVETRYCAIRFDLFLVTVSNIAYGSKTAQSSKYFR